MIILNRIIFLNINIFSIKTKGAMYLLNLILIFQILFIVSSCSSSNPVKTDKVILTFDEDLPVIQGWAGAPNSMDKKPFDFFYVRTESKASTKAIKKKTGAMMQLTCIDAAFTGLRGSLWGKLISSESISGTSSDYESTKVPLVPREFKENLQDVRLLACKPLYANEENLLYGGWRDCACIIYINIPGGKDTIINRIQRTNL